MRSKYKFHNVLVADAKLLLPMASGSQPDVLVLNSKLYKCQAHQANCSSCCLQVERPEFRRRMGFDEPSECFADCGRRRAVDVELSARSQLGGKLVLLALPKLDISLDSSPDSSIRCQTVNTWPFSRFNLSSSTSDPMKQVSYARLSSKQLPSMLIDSVDISWNRDNHRELVSLTLRPTLSSRLELRHNSRQVLMEETLLVSELDCHRSQRDANRSAGRFDESDVDLATGRRIHLLTLINRQLSTVSHQPSFNLNGKLVQLNSLEGSKQMEVGSESHIDYPPGSFASNINGETTAPTRARSIVPTNVFQPSEEPSSSIPGQPSGAAEVIQLQVPFLHNKYEFKANESTRMGPSLLLEHDLTRIRLRSSGFLVVALSSGLIILTYTLCLIAYLRWRHKSRYKSREPANKSTVEAVVPIQKLELDISQPYNLQMPPATRTRLNMMLRRGSNQHGIGIKSMESPSLNKASSHVGPTELRLAERRRRSRILMAATNQRGLESISSRTNKVSKMGNQAAGVQPVYYKQQQQQRQLNFGSINVVRAIRQAATLARSRLNLHSRYRPNLNVIPESDLEYLQSPRGDVYRGLFDHNNMVYISSRRTRPGAQFDTLVQDAMRTDCSHYVDKLTSQTQATATLLAKPIEEITTSPKRAVSRSKILRKVTQEDLFGNQNGQVAEL